MYNNTLNPEYSGGFDLRKKYLFLALAALCLGVGACTDEDPVKPAEFAVTIQVTDTAGDPVDGLRVGLVNDNPYLPNAKMSGKAATKIQFKVPVTSRVRLTIEDIEGREIRILTDDELSAGYHQVVWNGLGSADVHQPSGRYTVHMVAMELGTNRWLFEDRTDMLLAMLDMSRVPAGYTDANGRLVLKDKKLFPHLYDLPDMSATDENGQIMGKLSLTPLMRISLADENGGGSMWFKEDMIEGTVLKLVWNPRAATALQPTDQGVGTAGADLTGPPPGEIVFELDLVYSNPFN